MLCTVNKLQVVLGPNAIWWASRRIVRAIEELRGSMQRATQIMEVAANCTIVAPSRETRKCCCLMLYVGGTLKFEWNVVLEQELDF